MAPPDTQVEGTEVEGTEAEKTDVSIETATGAEVAPPTASANVGTESGQVVEDTEDDILDLSTLVPNRKKIRLPVPDPKEGEPDSAVHELRLLDDFGIIDQQRLLSWSRRFEELWNRDHDISDDESVLMLDLMNKMFMTVLDAPQEVKDATPDHIRSRVVTAFTLVPLIERQRQEAKEAEEAEKEKKSVNPSTSES